MTCYIPAVAQPRPLRTLLVDNHDSFTYNIFQMVAEVNGVAPRVVRNDEMPWAALDPTSFDNVILSPGPGRPDDTARFGISADAIRFADVPVLGVCLGHQGIGHAFGAQVVAAPTVMHGRRDTITHDGSALFTGIPTPFSAVRYHSLCVRDLPDELIAMAHSSDGVVMALRHRERPLYGVQFHPESIASEGGRRLFENFARLTDRRFSVATPRAPGRGARAAASSALKLWWRKVATSADTPTLFQALFADGRLPFWLDSSRNDGAHARFSFMGNGEGPLSHLVRYDVRQGALQIVSAMGSRTEATRLFPWTEAQLTRMRVWDDALPFDFQCGYVGYLGYELKADCGAKMGPPSPYPDAQLLFADRLLAFDHRTKEAYLVCVSPADEAAQAEAWIDAIATQVARTEATPSPGPLVAAAPLTWSHDAQRYRRQFALCQAALLAGDSYEICLTNAMRCRVRPDPLALHLALRRHNPAPYAAYLAYEGLQVVCSSPERFLTIDRRHMIETRPIKGTAPRGATPAEDEALAAALRGSEKDRSENLMIVDVLRNDLGRVCEVGSVEVPKLMEIERHATVHQLVSTVRGRLREEVSAVDAIRAAFPGGSMTGAPKLRTMEILDQLEGAARGPYAGAIGYLSLSGAADLNIVIRTVLVDDEGCSVAAGGAITVLSEVESELAELLLKTEAPRRAVATTTLDTR